jgi:hypothetical protein
MTDTARHRVAVKDLEQHTAVMERAGWRLVVHGLPDPDGTVMVTWDRRVGPEGSIGVVAPPAPMTSRAKPTPLATPKRAVATAVGPPEKSKGSHSLELGEMLGVIGAVGTIIAAISWIANGASATVILTYVAVAAFGSYLGFFPGLFLAAGMLKVTDEKADWALVFPLIGAVAGAIWALLSFDIKGTDSTGKAWGALLGLLVLGFIVFQFKRWDARRKQAAA